MLNAINPNIIILLKLIVYFIKSFGNLVWCWVQRSMQCWQKRPKINIEIQKRSVLLRKCPESLLACFKIMQLSGKGELGKLSDPICDTTGFPALLAFKYWLILSVPERSMFTLKLSADDDVINILTDYTSVVFAWQTLIWVFSACCPFFFFIIL